MWKFNVAGSSIPTRASSKTSANQHIENLILVIRVVREVARNTRRITLRLYICACCYIIRHQSFGTMRTALQPHDHEGYEEEIPCHAESW